jgi:hypothetical protein
VRTFLAAALALFILAPPAVGSNGLLLGTTDPLLAETNPLGSQREAMRLAGAGLGSVRLALDWSLGETRLAPTELVRLTNAARAAKAAHLRLVLAVFPAGSRQTPLDASDQADFAEWAASIARSLPSVHDFVVGNEPNLNRFWLPQFGPDGEDVAAPAFVDLLAHTYDTLKAVSPAIRVWGGGLARSGSDRPGTVRDTHSPVAFVTDMGAAYRASGRTLPIMDGLAYHPYMENSSIPPSRTHSDVSTTITIADYARLVALLGQAFDGTAQPGSTLPILYDEFGVESIVPSNESGYYSGSELATVHAVDPRTQARYYASAARLAYCEPSVVGFFVFPFEDEHALAGWQSGVYYANAAAKPSLGTLRWIARKVAQHTFAC